MNMTIVNQNNELQNFTIIPKGYVEGFPILLEVRDNQTNLVYEYNAVNIVFDFYDLVTFECELDCLYEGGFYDVNIYSIDLSVSKLIYKDKLFSTDQPIQSYSVNNDTYITLNTQNNDYIVL